MKLYKNYDEALVLLDQLDEKFSKIAVLTEYIVELRRLMRLETEKSVSTKKHRISIENMQNQLVQASLNRYETYRLLKSYNEVFNLQETSLLILKSSMY